MKERVVIHKERRKDKRYETSLQVELIQADGGSRFYSGSVMNVSASGACIKMECTSSDLDGAVELKITLPDNKTCAPAVGDIVWKVINETSCLVGIKFLFIDKEAQEGLLSSLT